ncbi:MAG TPA: hypothetical protein VGN20_26435 [Mucilaginibacter sp.]|jgi:uncharacterized membrane protein YphA (DoxX/SURF4 family)
MQANTKNVKEVQTILRLTFGLVPIVAGADKFTNLLTNWEQYLNPSLKMISPVSSHTFMMIVGVIEIAAGIIVLVKPQIGAWIVSAWLVLIALTLIVSGSFLDVAVRDLVMAIGAFSLGKLSKTNNLKNV